MKMIYLVLLLYSFQFETTEVELTFISESEGGTINFAVYGDEKTFMEKEISGHSIPAGGAKRVIRINVPNQPLAITAYHDLDENGELNTNIVGIPNEPYGFSNNARGTFGPPSYKSCKFDPSTEKALTIYLK